MMLNIFKTNDFPEIKELKKLISFFENFQQI